jgi:GTP-binding protein
VGKSSLLNHLFLRRDLVKTSATPGKTRTIQFFCVDQQVLFVDLPGYGYAKTSQTMRKEWSAMVENYFKDNSRLKVTLLLLDIRRTPSEEDLHFIEWATYQGSSLILVITKADKVSASQRKSCVAHILAHLDLPHGSPRGLSHHGPTRGPSHRSLPYVLYSTTKNLGRDQLIGLIAHLLD